jgi:hypothetical protein
VYTVTGNITLFAKWQSNVTYSVTYLANGASGTAPQAQTVEPGTEITLPGAGDMRLTDRIFAGWNTSAGGTGAGYTAGELYTVNANTVLYAQWKIIPLDTPGMPSLTPGLWQLSVSWEPVAGANQYDVYYGKTEPPATLATTTALTTTTITELEGGMTYYVRIRARNANSTSDYGPSANNSPESGTPGLYRAKIKIGEQNLTDSLSYIWNNAVNGDDYRIVIGADETISPNTNLHYADRTVKIMLLGHDSEKTIGLNANGNIFRIGRNVTLTLGSNVTLMGRTANTASLVQINSFGTLIMNDGAKISGNVIGNYGGYGGGGVYVSSGAFTMHGGEISGNTVNNTNQGGGGGGVAIGGGTFTMRGGVISGNITSSRGGGVCVYGGAFAMHGGEINGNTATIGGGTFVSGQSSRFTIHGGTISANIANSGGGVYVTDWGKFTMNNGIVSGNTANYSGGGVFVSNSSAWDTTVTMNGGVISGNTALNGGGVYVHAPSQSSSNITFIKESSISGTSIIYGAEAEGVDANGLPLKNTATSDTNPGHAVYASYSQVRLRNITAGQADHINTFTGMGISFNGNPPFGP